MHGLQQLCIYFSIDNRWCAKHCRIANIKTTGFLEHLKVLLYPTVLEIVVFGSKLSDINDVK